MNQIDLQTAAFELAVGYTGYGFPRLSYLVDQKDHTEFPIRVPTKTCEYSMAILDITLSRNGDIRLIEANGSNGGLTSIVFGNDNLRAQHMFLSFKSKREYLLHPSVVLLPFKSGFMHLPEFFRRACEFAQLVSKERSVALRSAGEILKDEDVSIIAGPVSHIVNSITRQKQSLLYQKRKVTFACNPNILPELARRKIISDSVSGYNVDTAIFHENKLVPIIHDKALQQKVSETSGIMPLLHEVANNIDEGVKIVLDFHKKGIVVVGKMNAGSGAAGIVFFLIGLSNYQIYKKLHTLIEDAKRKYGKNVARTIFPIRFFEFVESTPFKLPDGSHLWDIRIQCLIYPGFVELTPSLIRICPKAFDGKSYHRDRVVSNLTDRKPSLEFIRSPVQQSTLEQIGVTDKVFKDMLYACARWCENACTFFQN